MTDDNKPHSLWETIRNWAFNRWGIWGLILLALVSVSCYLYTNWDKVQKWPSVAYIADYITRSPIPKADPNRFSVMVAHLENDTNREYEHLIREALKEFEGTQVILLDRTISLEGSVPEEAEKRGHESAHSFLKQSGASVCIWGIIIRQSNHTVPKLYWTSSRGGEVKPKRYAVPQGETQLLLPDVFWSDLADILKLLVALHDEEFRTEEGRYVADRLSPFITRVRTLLQASTGRPGWDLQSRTRTLIILADALHVLGNQNGKNVRSVVNSGHQIFYAASCFS